jgi:acetylornithine deacetylase
MSIEILQNDALDLLKSLVQTPSLSKQEKETADIIESFFALKGIKTERIHENIIARSPQFDETQPTILLNSHHDTVKVVEGWTKDPFGAEVIDGKLYGLGTNDAGASLVGLISTFLYFEERKQNPFNLLLVASAEEEIFGEYGIGCLVDSSLPQIDLGIVGEPTGMQMAVAEKGLLVIDGYVKGVAGHAARKDGVNAINLALIDIAWLNSYEFIKQSSTLGNTLMTVTQIEAGHQHNVIPDACHFVVDVRVNDRYTLEEVLKIIRDHTEADMRPRSIKWHPSGIDVNHPIVQKGISIGMKIYGSPTLSDQVHLSGIPSVKIGIGESVRSHTPDEYIFIEELNNGIIKYIELLDGIIIPKI